MIRVAAVGRAVLRIGAGVLAVALGGSAVAGSAVAGSAAAQEIVCEFAQISYAADHPKRTTVTPFSLFFFISEADGGEEHGAPTITVCKTAQKTGCFPRSRTLTLTEEQIDAGSLAGPTDFYRKRLRYDYETVLGDDPAAVYLTRLDLFQERRAQDRYYARFEATRAGRSGRFEAPDPPPPPNPTARFSGDGSCRAVIH